MSFKRNIPGWERAVRAALGIEELTAPEAASELGISVEAVKSRLHRARSMLREKLLNAGYWTS